VLRRKDERISELVFTKTRLDGDTATKHHRNYAVSFIIATYDRIDTRFLHQFETSKEQALVVALLELHLSDRLRHSQH
jgi:hypothetical protein